MPRAVANFNLARRKCEYHLKGSNVLCKLKFACVFQGFLASNYLTFV